MNGAVDIGATEGLTNGAAFKVEGDITVDVGSETFVSICCSRVIESTLGAAEDGADGTATDSECDVAVNLSIVGAAIHFAEFTGATGNNQFTVTEDVGLVTAAVEVTNDLSTTCGIMVNLRGNDFDVAHLVAAAEKLSDKAGVDNGSGFAMDIGWHLLTDITIDGSIAATKDLSEATSVDNQVGIGIYVDIAHIGGGTAAVEFLDSVFTTIDMYCGTVSRLRQIVGVITSAVDCPDSISLDRIVSDERSRIFDSGRVFVMCGVVTMSRTVDVDGNIALGSAGILVAAVDLVLGAAPPNEGGLAAVCTVAVVFADVDSGVAAHAGATAATVEEG